MRRREVSHGRPLQAREEPPLPSIWSNASIWSFADGCAVSRHQRNAGSQQHFLCPQLYWQATEPVRENTQSRALAPVDTLISTLHSNNPTLPLKTAHARSLPTCGQQTARSNFECTTTTLLSSVRHQGRNTTTVMGRRSTQSKNTTYIQTNQTPR